VTKLAFWAEPELEERLSALHGEMAKEAKLRGLNLTKTDVIKSLIRQSLFWEWLERFGTFYDESDPADARTFLREQYERRLAILNEMCADYDALVAKNAAKKKRPK
jgi:hypothetical protein